MRILITHQASDNHLEAIRQAVPNAELIIAREVDEIAQEMPTANVIWGSRFLAEKLPEAKELALIQVSSAGVDHLLSDALKEHPAQLLNARGIHGATIAEHVLLLMLALARQFPSVQRAKSEQKWIRVTPTLIKGKTMGIVGYGSIGQALAERAKAFGMKVIGTRRHASPDQWADEVWDNGRLNELLGVADYLVLATPLTEETHHLIGQNELRQMKSSAVLINIARGQVVDETALIEALKDGTIGAAGLDVFEEEPLPSTSPLWGMDNVIVTPHMAGHMPDYDDHVVEILIENLRRYQAGQPLINVVNKQAGY